VLGRENPGAWALRGRVKGSLYSFGVSELPADEAGAYLRQEAVFVRPASAAPDRKILELSEIALRGAHNLLNVLAACAVAEAAGLSDEAMRSGVRGFGGVLHRLEFVRRWNGADWYNDSIATAPERAMAAIRSFHEPLILLAGGRDKKLPWGDLMELVRQRVDHLVVFGEAAEIILQALEHRNGERLTVQRCTGLKEAVQAAAQLAQPGDVVLLSPGGTSFDEFRDFEERGECFARWVRDLP
jgi:UDP-N-acetylmuramoylalanine--D-glutamate ligase